MEKNQNTIDRTARIVVGLILLSLAFFGPKTAWGYIGIIPILIGAFGVCPLYTIIGRNNCPLGK